MLFCICSDSGMTGTDVRVGSCRYLLNQQTLVMCEGTLPTGSPTSQFVVYWFYSDMFENIYEIAQKYKCEFMLCVDDMTFSSNIGISKQLRKDVEELLNSYCLHAKAKKDHYYQNNAFKKVTGVGIKKGNCLYQIKKDMRLLKCIKPA